MGVYKVVCRKVLEKRNKLICGSRLYLEISTEKTEIMPNIEKIGALLIQQLPTEAKSELRFGRRCVESLIKRRI